MAKPIDTYLLGRHLNNQDVTLDKVVETIQMYFPDVWKRYYTRHVDSPGNYTGYKTMIAALSSATAEVILSGQGAAANAAVNALILEKYDFPTYYVSEPLFRAMQHTHPPAGMKWSDIVWPFPALVFMLPRGVLYEQPGGAEIFMMGVARTDPNETYILPGTKIQVKTLPDARVDVFWSTKPLGLDIQDCCFMEHEFLEPDVEWIDSHTHYDDLRIAEYIDVNDLPEGKFSSYMAGLVANMILVMQARESLLEPGRKTGRRLKSGVAVHSPTMLGRRYEIVRRQPKSAPTGAHFTELRWRAGHIRRNHAERGWDDRENLILIDPYIAHSAHLVREKAVAQ